MYPEPKEVLVNVNQKTAWTPGVTVTMLVTVPILAWALTLELLDLRQLSLPFTIAGLATMSTGIVLVGRNLPRSEKKPSRYGNARTTGTPFPMIAFAIILAIAVINFAAQQL